MSFDIYLMAFEGGESTTADPELTRPILAPLVVEQSDGFALLRTAEGELDCYGWPDCEGFMFNHVSGAASFDLLVEIAHAGRLAIMPVGCGTLVTDPALLADLPDGIPEPIQVITSGAELVNVIETA